MAVNIYEIDNTRQELLVNMISAHMYKEIKGFTPFFNKTDNTIQIGKTEKIHWFESTVKLAEAILLQNKPWQYFHNRFFILCLELKHIHPIDFLYEHHLKIINKQEPFSKHKTIEKEKETVVNEKDAKLTRKKKRELRKAKNKTVSIEEFL